MTTSALSALEAISEPQRGLFSSQQAREHGITRHALRNLEDRHVIVQVAPRVFRSTLASPMTWVEELMAQQLSCGASAAGWSALALHGLADPPRRPELLVLRSRRNLGRELVHSTVCLPRSDLTTVDGIGCTTVPRSLVEACRRLSVVDASTLIARAVVKRTATLPEVLSRAAQLVAPARPGAQRILDAAPLLDVDLDRARNEWEAEVLRLVARLGLPEPTCNHRVFVGGRWRELDVAWAPIKVDLEFDGYLPHMSDRRQFDDDRDRQNDLVAAGWTVFRLTSTSLRRDGVRALDALAAVVRARSAPVCP